MITTIKANVIPTALGRVWSDDEKLRAALEKDPEIAFSYQPAGAGWPTQWNISVRYHDGPQGRITLIEGRMAGLRFGAELFRKLTGKEVDVDALLKTKAY